MTDVTGFGLAGHLYEMAAGSGLSAEIAYSKIPVIAAARRYAAAGINPDATFRNWNQYGNHIEIMAEVDMMDAFRMLPDPQTNGGLLIAVSPDAEQSFVTHMAEWGYTGISKIGRWIVKGEKAIVVHQ